MAFSPEEIGQIIEQFIETVGTRQYIGARYVPIFGRRGEQSIEWDNSAPYEPLTIVHYQGNSYTSRQYVPAGVDITNADYWAATGTYNAQIAAYVAQVQQFDGRITAAEEDIDALQDAVGNIMQDDMHIYLPPIDGSAVVLTDGRKTILFDVASSSSGAALNNWIRSELGIDHIDACVITHFHPDHAGGFNALTGLFNPATLFFEQMPATTTNAEYNQYTQYRNAIHTICSNLGFLQPVVPDQGQIVRVGDFDLEFGNTILSNRLVYDTTRGNNGYDNNDYSSLNNYSLITYVTHGNVVYLDAGDLEGEGQRLNLPYMRKATVARNPHHFSNRMGYMPWYLAIEPDYWVVTMAPGQSASIGGSYHAYISYLYRYVRYGNGTNIVLASYDRDVHVHFNGGNCVEASGNRMIAEDSDDGSSGGATIYASLPPTYYNTNPYILHDMTLAEWVAAVATGANDTWVLHNSGFMSDSQMRIDLSTEMVGGYSQSTANSIALWGLTKQGAIVHVQAYSADHRVNYLDLYTATYAGPDSLAGKKKYSEDPWPVSIDFPNGITAGSYYTTEGADSTSVGRLMKSTIIGANLLGTTTCIPCIRANSNMDGGNGNYRGFSMNASGTLLYFVALASDHVTGARQVNIATGATENIQLGNLHSIG